MRNFKRLVALLLVMACVTALVPFASAADSAPDFTDADQIRNIEAVELLVSLGILKGHTDGTFAPKDNLTRAESAKVMYAATRGYDDGAGVFGGSMLFSDVAKTHWAIGYINYSAAMEYVIGKGNGRFDPEGPTTGYEFLKMLLCALGFDQNTEKFVGQNWEFAVLSAAIRMGLTADFEGSLADPITRDNMALVTANMIAASTVRYDANGRAVETGITFGEDKLGLVNITGILVANTDAAIDEYSITSSGSIILVGEKAVNVPASTDMLDLGKEVSVLVAVKSGKQIVDASGNYNSAAIDRVFGSIEPTSNNVEIELNGKETYNTEARFYINFEAKTKDDVLELNDLAGHYVRAYSTDGDKTVDIVIAIEYQFSAVSNVSSKGVVTIAGNNLDEDNAVMPSDLETGDNVVWFEVFDGKTIVARVETKEGKASGYTASYVIIDGKHYAPATALSGFETKDAPLGKNATWFLWNGYILGCTEEGEAIIPNYAVVIRSTRIGWEYRVEVLTDGGQGAVYNLANPDDVVSGDDVPFGLYTYSIEENGAIKLEAVEITGDNQNTFAYENGSNTLNGKLVNSKTIVFAGLEDGWMVYTGINKIPSLDGAASDSRKVYTILGKMFTADDAIAVVVIPEVALGDDETSADAHSIILSDIVYIGDSKYTFTAWDGKELKNYTTTVASLETGLLYNFTQNTSGIVTAAAEVTGTKGYLTAAADFSLRIGTAGSSDGTVETYTNDTVCYVINIDNGTVTASTLADIAKTPADQVSEKDGGSYDTVVVKNGSGIVTHIYKYVEAIG